MTTAIRLTEPGTTGKTPPPTWPRDRLVEVQRFATVRQLPYGLGSDIRLICCERLNRVVADSQVIYALYKKYHWTVHGPTFAPLHALFEQHACEQSALIDGLAERIQTLGGVAVGDPRHVAQLTDVARPPDGVEAVPVMLSRLLAAHDTVLVRARDAIGAIAAQGDDVSHDLLVSEVLRTGERQAWILAQHLFTSTAPERCGGDR